MYILSVLTNDLACNFNRKFVILPHISLYTLKTNYLTQWSTFIHFILYEICIYWVFEWIISHVFSMISVLSHFICPYTPWKRMILLTDQRLSRQLYNNGIYCIFVGMISSALSIPSVLFQLICPNTYWKKLIVPIDQLLWTVWYITWTYCMFVWMISQVSSIIRVLSWFTCPYKPWKRMILCTGQDFSRLLVDKVYILNVCMDVLNCLVNDRCVIRIQMSLHNLKMNDLTHWSTLIKRMVYHMYTLNVCMNDLDCLVLS